MPKKKEVKTEDPNKKIREMLEKEEISEQQAATKYGVYYGVPDRKKK